VLNVVDVERPRTVRGQARIGETSEIPGEASMHIGDNVRVRANGRRARIIEDLGNSHYRVLYYADPEVDALDSSTPQDEDDAGGVYMEADLEVITT
jgi:hypothetical protein